MTDRVSREVLEEERVRPPMHPGRVLELEFLEPAGISAYRLAKDIKVDQMRVHKILRGERSITPDTALRLSRYFGMSERFWLNVQAHYDLEMTKMQSGEEIEREVRPMTVAASPEPE